MPWLIKTEPSAYSFDDLVKERETLWTGVTNPVAVKNLRAMKKGDKVVVYHTGNEKAAVGTASVATDPAPDPKDSRAVLVRIAAGKKLKEPVTLETVKRSAPFADSPLVRIGRLSVVLLTDEQYAFLTKV